MQNIAVWPRKSDSHGESTPRNAAKQSSTSNLFIVSKTKLRVTFGFISVIYYKLNLVPVNLSI